MTLRTSFPAVALLMALLFCSSRALQKLHQTARAYENAGRADFSQAALREEAPRTFGAMYRISSGDAFSRAVARGFAEELARKHHHNSQWIREFLVGCERVERAQMTDELRTHN